MPLTSSSGKTTVYFGPTKGYRQLRLIAFWAWFGLMAFFFGYFFLEKGFPQGGEVQPVYLLGYVLVMSGIIWAMANWTTTTWVEADANGLLFHDYLGKKKLFWSEAESVRIERRRQASPLSYGRMTVNFLAFDTHQGKPFLVPITPMDESSAFEFLTRGMVEQKADFSLLVTQLPTSVMGQSLPKKRYVSTAIIMILLSLIIMSSRFGSTKREQQTNLSATIWSARDSFLLKNYSAALAKIEQVLDNPNAAPVDICQAEHLQTRVWTATKKTDEARTLRLSLFNRVPECPPFAEEPYEVAQCELIK